MHIKQLLLSALCAVLLPTVAVAQTPNVVVTIKPLHSLVVGVLGDSTKAQLLLAANTSPHDFHLKPLQLKMMQQADVVFYVDDSFETFLLSALEILPQKVVTVPLARTAQLSLLPYRSGGLWESHAHDKHGDDEHAHNEHAHDKHAHEAEAHHHDEAHHSHDGDDMHVWLAPKNAQKMAVAIGEVLAVADPENRTTYRTNARSLVEKIDALDTRLKVELSEIRAQPFVVFHDAYQYFEHAYGLNAIGSITLEPDMPAAPQRIKALRTKLQQTGARCIFREPQFPDRLIDTISEGMSVRIGTLDPLGAELTPDGDLYFKLLENLALNLKRCLVD